jgi:hypothetical protein
MSQTIARTNVPRHLWTRSLKRLGGIDTREISWEQRVTYTSRLEAVFNARRGSK